LSGRLVSITMPKHTEHYGRSRFVKYAARNILGKPCGRTWSPTTSSFIARCATFTLPPVGHWRTMRHGSTLIWSNTLATCVRRRSVWEENWIDTSEPSTIQAPRPPRRNCSAKFATRSLPSAVLLSKSLLSRVQILFQFCIFIPLPIYYRYHKRVHTDTIWAEFRVPSEDKSLILFSTKLDLFVISGK
jgi:hypothetical protein